MFGDQWNCKLRARRLWQGQNSEGNVLQRSVADDQQPLARELSSYRSQHHAAQLSDCLRVFRISLGLARFPLPLALALSFAITLGQQLVDVVRYLLDLDT